jgi:hypothetical protein
VQRHNPAGYIAAGRDLRDQPLDLSFGPKARSRQELRVVFLGQIGPDQQQAGQVQGGFREHVEQDRELPRQTRRATAALRLVLRHAQLVNAISVERGAGALAMDAARFDLPEMDE